MTEKQSLNGEARIELHELKRFVSDWSSKVVDGKPFDELFQFEGIPLSWIYLPILYSSLLPPPFVTVDNLARKKLPGSIKIKTFSILFRRYLLVSEKLKWSLSRLKTLKPLSLGVQGRKEKEMPSKTNGAKQTTPKGKVLFLTFTNHLSKSGDIFRISRILEEIKKDGRCQEQVLLVDPISRWSLQKLLEKKYKNVYEYYGRSILQQAAAPARELSAAWKAISPIQKKQLLQYRQQDLFFALQHNLDFLYSPEFIQLTLTFYLAFKKIIAQDNIKAIVLSSQNNIFEKCLTAAAQQYQIPVFVIQHGTGLATLQSIDAPAHLKFAVFGKYYQQRLQKLGVKAANIQSTGPIIFDGIEEYRRPNTPGEKSNPTLLFVTSPLVEDRFLSQKTYFERMRAIIRNLKQLKLPLQLHLHLRERNAARYEKILQEEGVVAEVIADNSRKKHYALIRQCSVLLNFGSTTAVEAMIIGRPTLTINLFEGDLPTNPLIFESGATTICKYSENLAPVIQSLLHHNPKEKEAEEYVQHLCGQLDGKASRRIVEWIYREMH